MSENTAPLKSPFSYYSTREAAKALGVSVTTIQLWVESGALSAWKTAGGHRRIPREAVDAMRAQQGALIASEQASRACSVLVVEDDPVQLELYRIKFSEWNLPIALHLAQNGFEGLLMAGKYAPNLIVADLSMPGMDGFEMIRHLVGSKAVSIPSLVVVTALTQAEIESNGGLPTGIPVYSKPIPFGVLKHIIERTIQRVAA